MTAPTTCDPYAGCGYGYGSGYPAYYGYAYPAYYGSGYGCGGGVIVVRQSYCGY